MKKIIFISGDMCAGKTTLADLLRSVFAAQGKTVEILKFADPLYAFMQSFTDEKHREFLVKSGELAREIFGNDALNHAFRRKVAASTADIIICDDMRTQVEYNLGCELGAFMVRVEAPVEVRRQRGEKLGIWSDKPCKTEGKLGDMPHDVTVHNTGTVSRNLVNDAVDIVTLVGKEVAA